MKKKFFSVVFVAASLIITPYLQAAINWDITEGTQTIESGNEYGWVGVYNDAKLIVNGGYTSHITSNSTSTVDIYGNLSPTLSLEVKDQSVVNVYGGIIYGIGIGTATSATVNLYGGNISYIAFPASDTFTINIHGYDFYYSNSFLSGYWLDGSSFNILIRNSVYPSDNVNLVPEPASLAMLGLGYLFFKIKQPKRMRSVRI